VLTEGQLSHWQNSVSLWKHELDLQIVSPVAFNNYGGALQDSGELAKAIPVYERGRKVAPPDKEARFNPGGAMQKQRKWDEAAENFRDLCKLVPNSADPHIRLADVCSETKDRLDEAAREYRKALEFDQNQSATHCNLGKVEMARNHLKEAAESY